MDCEDLGGFISADRIEKEIAGKPIPYDVIASEHAEEPSNWYLDREFRLMQIPMML